MVQSCYCMQAKIKHAHLFYLGIDDFEGSLWWKFLLIGHSRPLFLYRLSLPHGKQKINILLKNADWVDSNPGSLELEAIAQTTVPRPLAYVNISLHKMLSLSFKLDAGC